MGHFPVPLSSMLRVLQMHAVAVVSSHQDTASTACSSKFVLLSTPAVLLRNGSIYNTDVCLRPCMIGGFGFGAA